MNYYLIADSTTNRILSIVTSPQEPKGGTRVREISLDEFKRFNTLRGKAEKPGDNQRRFVGIDDPAKGIREATASERAALAPVPPVITPAQLRLWLNNAGIPANSVDNAIAAIPDEKQRQEASIRWEYTTEIRRDNPLVDALAQTLGLTEAQVDQAFRDAAKL
jgi:hypothetical protein